MFQGAYSSHPASASAWWWLPTSGRGRTAVLAAAAGLTAVALAWLALSAEEGEASKVKAEEVRPETPKGSAEQELLLRVLAELRRRLFHVAREASFLTKDIRLKLAAKGVAIEETQFREELSQQFGIAQKFKVIQAEVMAQFGCSEATLTTLTEETAAEVRGHAEAVRQMLHDALGGVAPALPCAVVPQELTAERLIDFYRRIQKLKIEKARRLAAQTGSRKFSSQELGSAVALMSQAAEQEIVDENRELLGEGGELYHTAMAMHCRSSEFSERLACLDKDHKSAMVAAFRDGTSEID